MQKFLPTEIIWQKGKTGYEPPQKEWMQQKILQEMVMEARKKLVHQKVLQPSVLKSPLQPAGAHEARNFDWHCLNLAYLF